MRASVWPKSRVYPGRSIQFLIGCAFGAALVAGCNDSRSPTSAAGSSLQPLDGSRIRGSYVCTVVLASRGQPRPTMSCKPAGDVAGRVIPGDAAADVILGKQNVNVTLNFSNFAFNNVTRIFSFNATVTNLLAQPIGTLDGVTTTPQGTRVFFSAGPFASGGVEGPVTVSNPDGMGNFLGKTVPFFRYVPFIPAKATSGVKVWQFLLGPGVTGLSFQVEVDAAVPAQTSVLRWVVLRQGLTQQQLNGVWRNTASDIWAVGLNRAILHFDGTQWTVPNTGLQFASYTSVFGSSGSDVFAVGGGGVASHFNGVKWTRNVVTLPGGVHPNFTSVWGSAPTNFYATANGGIAVHFNGVTVSRIVFPFGVVGNLHGVWGSDASHVFIVGDNGQIFFFNGSVWSKATSNTAQALFAIWGSASNDVYAVGHFGTIVHFNGTTWTVQASGTGHALSGVGGTGPGDVWAVGATGVTQHFNGTSWSTVPRVAGMLITAICSGSPGPLWAVGSGGALFSVSGGAFTLSNQSGLPLNAVWASSATDVWASTTGTVLHFDGTNWTSAAVSDQDSMDGLWGTGPANVYAVGVFGTIAHFNGTTWGTSIVNPPGGAIGYRSVWGLAGNNIYAVGNGGLVEHFDGSGWSFVTRTGAGNLTGVWGGAPNTFFAVANDGTAYRSVGGGPWSAMSFVPANANPLGAVFGTAANNNVWTAGNSGIVYRFAGGAGFVQPVPNNNTANNLHGTWLFNGTDVYLVGDAGIVRHFNGTSWQTLTTPVATPLRSAFGTARQNVYVSGDVGVVLLGTGP